MLIFRACPKCVTGALSIGHGLDGLEVRCVNCALTVEVAPGASAADAVRQLHRRFGKGAASSDTEAAAAVA